MALGDSDTGFGASITFQSGLCAKIRNIDYSASRDAIDTTHAASANNSMEFIPQAFYDPGEITCEMIFNPGSAWQAALEAAAASCTLTFPNVGTAAGTIAATAFLTEYSISVPYDDVMTVNATIKLAGDNTYTAAT